MVPLTPGGRPRPALLPHSCLHCRGSRLRSQRWLCGALPHLLTCVPCTLQWDVCRLGGAGRARGDRHARWGGQARQRGPCSFSRRLNQGDRLAVLPPQEELLFLGGLPSWSAPSPPGQRLISTEPRFGLPFLQSTLWMTPVTTPTLLPDRSQPTIRPPPRAAKAAPSRCQAAAQAAATRHASRATAQHLTVTVRTVGQSLTDSSARCLPPPRAAAPRPPRAPPAWARAAAGWAARRGAGRPSCRAATCGERCRRALAVGPPSWAARRARRLASLVSIPARQNQDSDLDCPEEVAHSLLSCASWGPWLSVARLAGPHPRHRGEERCLRLGVARLADPHPSLCGVKLCKRCCVSALPPQAG